VKPDQKEQQREICKYILAYLSDNPDAGDTFDGIAEWWLLSQQIKFETRNVSEAVARLVSEGLIEEHQGADTRKTYRINKARAREIRNMLRRAQRSSDQ
jgi:DNA-binding PadR family transcriptional regulator